MKHRIAAAVIACALAWSVSAAGQSTASQDLGITDEEMGLSQGQIEASKAQLDEMNAPAVVKPDFPDTAAKCGASAAFQSRVGKDRNDEALRTRMDAHADFWWQYLLGRVGQEKATPLVAQARQWLQATGRADGVEVLIGMTGNQMIFCESYERIIRRQTRK